VDVPLPRPVRRAGRSVSAAAQSSAG
jgi:hypothetical protein